MERLQWTQAEIKTYANRTHGPDGTLFFDPAITKQLTVEAPGRLLDMGCGTGFWSLTAARLGWNVDAFDIADEMVARTRQAVSSEELWL